MRTSLRVFAASVCTLFAAAFLVAVPFTSPAHAVAGFNRIDIGSATATEGGDLHFSITLSPQVHADNISVTVATQNETASAASDYTVVSPSSTFTWGFNEAGAKDFVVHANQDTTREPNETFRVVFASPPTGADAGNTGVGTINDDDQAAGSVPQITASGGGNHTEGDSGTTNHDISVTVDKTYNQPVTVNYATQDGSAHAGSDYTATSGTLSFPQNVTSPQTLHVLVPVTGDTYPEPAENFFVTFSQNNNAILASNANQTVTIQAEDGPPPQITIATIPPQPEGDSGTSPMTVTLNASPLPKAGNPVTVRFDTSDGTAVASTQDTTGDYVAVINKTVTIGPSGTATVPITINGDLAQEPDEIFHVTLSNANNGIVGDPSSQDAMIQNDDFGQITTGAGPGGEPHVRTFGATGAELGGFYAFGGGLPSGVHVARGDIFKADGSAGADGVDEVIVGAGRLSSSTSHTFPLVDVYSITGARLARFHAFDDGFGGGVYVAAGNFDGNTANGDEIVAAAGPGGLAHVKVFKIQQGGDNTNAVDISSGGFFAYDQFHGGVHVAAANESGDAKDEIITGAGAGGWPHVRVWSLNGGSVTEVAGHGFLAYPQGFSGGVFVAATAGKIVTGAGPGGWPHVRVFDVNGVEQGTAGGFLAYPQGFSGGVSVAMGNLDHSPAPEIVTGAGPGGWPQVHVFDLAGGPLFGGEGFLAYPQGFRGGADVSIGGN